MDRRHGQARQHLVRRPLLQIEHRQLERIQRVLDHQAQFGVALHGQAAAEEQGVRVFLALRQAQEVMGAGAERQVGGLLFRAGGKALAVPGKVKGQPCIAHMDAQFFVQQQLAHIVGKLFGQHQVERADQQQRAGVGGQAGQQGAHGLGEFKREVAVISVRLVRPHKAAR